MTYATFAHDPEVRDGIRRLRLHHRRVHRITALANEESRHRAEAVAWLRDRAIPLSVIAAAIDVTIPAVQGILTRAGLTPMLGSGSTIHEEVGI